MEKTNWSNYNLKDILEKLHSSPQGLTDHEAILRFNKYGPNEIQEAKKINEFVIFLMQFKNPLVYLLIVAAIVTYFLGKNIDSAIILVIVFFNAIIGYFQERKAEKSMEALKKIMSLKTKVFRSSNITEISSLELVPGDIVILEAGMKIPADIRIIEAESLKVDESILTGESLPSRKKAGLLSNDVQIVDQTNMVFSGTIVDSGKGLGVVVSTGKNTELASIAEKVTTIKKEVTPLNKKLTKFSKSILVTTISISLLIFIIGIIREMEPINIFLTTVAIAVAIIPEGLPAVITIALAFGVHRMAKNNAIIRKLSSVETLGSVTVIASDKTGTLTYNEMTLEKIVMFNKSITISGDGYIPKGSFYINDKKVNPKLDSTLKKFLQVSVLCNNAALVKEEKEWKIIGDPTEGALIVASEKAEIYQKNAQKKYPRIDEIPFDNKNNFMATLHKSGQDKNMLAVKGTLEKILTNSKYYLKNDHLYTLDHNEKEALLHLANEEAREGHRILAVAYKDISKNKITKNDVSDLIFLGFSAMEDPPREDAISAIKLCKRAGIRVVMITGDFPTTAASIAEKMGIAKKDAIILTGDEISDMSKKKLESLVDNINVYARVTPEIKLKIVEALKNNNHIVGVTGDGINDSPILKASDVGIAMGIGGTDVAREAADMVLVDNNFANIVKAIKEGRTIYKNIRRAIFFLLSTNLAEATILLLSLIIGWPIPLTAIQILWINLITDGASGFALAMEPSSNEIMESRPKDPNEGILNKTMITKIILSSAVMSIITLLVYGNAINLGMPAEKAGTIVFVILAIMQILNIFNSRSLRISIFKIKFFSNPYIIYFSTSMILLTFLTTTSSTFRSLFHTVSLSASEWTIIMLLSLIIIFVSEIDKLIRNLLKSTS